MAIETTAPRLLFSAENLDSWVKTENITAGSTTLSHVASGEHVHHGGGALKFELTGVNNANWMRADHPDVDLDFSGGDTIAVGLGFDIGATPTEALEPGAMVRLWLSNEPASAFTGNYVRNQNLLNVYKKRPHEVLILHRDDFETQVGSFDFDLPIRSLRIHVQKQSGAGSTHLYFNAIYGEWTAPPMPIVFTFDDQERTQLEKIAVDFENYRWPAVLFVNSNGVGTGDNLTLAELKTLYEKNWDICSHGASHDDFTLETEAGKHALLDDWATWADAAGFIRARDLFAAPLGSFDTDTLTALTSRGLTYHRTTAPGHTTTNQRHNDSVLGLRDPQHLRTINLSSGAAETDTAAEVLAIIDAMKGRGGQSLWIYGHVITPSPADSRQYATAEWDLIVAGVRAREQAGEVRVMSANDFLTAAANPLPPRDQQPLAPRRILTAVENNVHSRQFIGPEDGDFYLTGLSGGETVALEVSADRSNWLALHSFTADGVYRSRRLPPGLWLRAVVTGATPGASAINLDLLRA